MEAVGSVAAGHRGALRVPAAGAVRRRAGDQDDGTAAVAGPHGVHVRSAAAARRPAWPRRADRARRARRRAGGRAGCRPAFARCSREGARHRRRRVHRLAPDRAAAGRRRRGRRASTASPTTTRARSRSATSRHAAAAPGSSSSRRASRRRICAALLDGVTHVFHLAAQAGVRKSWGRDFRIYTDNNVDATQRLLEACVGRPLERSSTRRAPLSMATPRDPDARRCAAQPRLAVRRHQAGSRASLSPLLREPRRPDGVAAVLHGLRTAAAAGHGVQPLHSRRAHGPADHALRRRRADARLHLRRATPSRRRSPPAIAACRVGPTTSGAARGCRAAGARHHGAPDRPSLDRSDARPRRRATCATRSRTRHWRAADLGFAPRCRSNRVWKRSIDGFDTPALA